MSVIDDLIPIVKEGAEPQNKGLQLDLCPYCATPATRTHVFIDCEYIGPSWKAKPESWEQLQAAVAKETSIARIEYPGMERACDAVPRGFCEDAMG